MAPGAVTPRPVSAQPSRTTKHSKTGKISGILSLSMLGLSLPSPFVLLLGELSGSHLFAGYLWFSYLAIIFGGSLVGLVLAAMTQFRGSWSILGGILSPISFLYSVAAAILLLLN